MEFRLPKESADAIRKLGSSNATNIIDYALEIGVDLSTFFEGEDWSGLDLRNCNLDGVSFRHAIMDGVIAYNDQWNKIIKSRPASFRLSISFERKRKFDSAKSRRAFQRVQKLFEQAKKQELSEIEIAKHGLAALDEIPNSIAQLHHLRHLDLQKTQISDLNPLSGLVELRYLSLEKTQVYDPSPLDRLVFLETLSLSGTRVNDASALSSLYGLKNLYLCGTQIENIEPLTNLLYLEHLCLDFTKVKDLSPLNNMRNLTSLQLRNSSVTDLSPLATLSTLEALRIDENLFEQIEPLRPALESGKLRLYKNFEA